MIFAIGRYIYLFPISGDWVKPGAVVIDCGINVEPVEQADGTTKNKLYGDVDFEAAKQVGFYHHYHRPHQWGEN